MPRDEPVIQKLTGVGDRTDSGANAGEPERFPANCLPAPSQGTEGSGHARPENGAPEPTAWNPQRSLEEIRDILLRRNLLDVREKLVAPMLEDLVHYAYFTGCLTRGEVGRLLGLTVDQARQKIRAWKKWHEGNRNCQARQNPFFGTW